MASTILITKQIDILTEEKFRFYLFETTLLFDVYILRKRESIRHRTWKTEKYYSRLQKSDSNMTLDEVPLTLGIRAEAIGKLIDLIVVKTESEQK